MWISRKKWNALKKRVADLEGRVQSQPIGLSENINPRLGDGDISDISSALVEELKKVVVNHLD